MKSKNGRIEIIIAMIIWGTIGVFVRWIELASMEIALFRSIIGFGFLIILSFIRQEEWDLDILKKNIVFLTLSGIALGTNWILLFESYKNTTISNATMSYYMAPIFIIILSRIIFKEKTDMKKVISIIGSMLGLFLIMGNQIDLDGNRYNHIRGIFFGLSAAIFYAIVVILNKSNKYLSGFKSTLIQLFISALLIFPILLMTDGLTIHTVDQISWLLLLIIGILHTGVAYLLYFDAIRYVKGQDIAILSYIDPIFSIIISALLLGEKMTGLQIGGGVLIIGFALLSEI